MFFFLHAFVLIFLTLTVVGPPQEVPLPMARQASENQQVRFFTTGLPYTVHRVLDEWMEKAVP